MDFEYIYEKNGLKYLTEEQTIFSDVYLAIREKENRILSDIEVLKLPLTSSKNNNSLEWKLRQKSANRFITYLKNKSEGLLILDIGCGNGWFSNLISDFSIKNQIIGLDINKEELEQATRVFNKENLQFVYGDIFDLKNIFFNKFDIICLNASIQYFSDFNKLITLLKQFLKINGEIHIIDSPFYEEKEIKKAKLRTELYYTNLGFLEMKKNYFHHKKTDIKDFIILYKPKGYIIRKISKKDTPFMWLKYSK